MTQPRAAPLFDAEQRWRWRPRRAPSLYGENSASARRAGIFYASAHTAPGEIVLNLLIVDDDVLDWLSGRRELVGFAVDVCPVLRPA